MSQNQRNKQLVWEAWGDGTGGTSAYAADARWHGPAPIGDRVGPAAVEADFWSPLLTSIPDLDRTTHLFFGGVSNGRADGDRSRDGRSWVTGTGVLTGTFSADYLTIPATGGPVEIRWGEFCCLEGDRVVEVYALIDLVDLTVQAGCPVLPPERGRPGLYPPPAAGDGILLDPQDGATSEYSLDHIRRFIFDGLNAYDRDELSSMAMADYFDDRLRWYGPGGIGACFGLTEFEQNHQIPWLEAFPDRRVGDLDALIAEGPYSGAPGWAGVEATHAGRYLDTPATGRTIAVNGLDWWKRDGERYIENWVFVDMVHLFGQFGVDLLEPRA